MNIFTDSEVVVQEKYDNLYALFNKILEKNTILLCVHNAWFLLDAFTHY